MASQTRILVTGAGGFIGNHLVNYLKDQGHWVRGVDIKRPEYSDTRADEFLEGVRGVLVDKEPPRFADAASFGPDDARQLIDEAVNARSA